MKFTNYLIFLLISKNPFHDFKTRSLFVTSGRFFVTNENLSAFFCDILIIRKHHEKKISHFSHFLFSFFL